MLLNQFFFQIVFIFHMCLYVTSGRGRVVSKSIGKKIPHRFKFCQLRFNFLLFSYEKNVVAEK